MHGYPLMPSLSKYLLSLHNMLGIFLGSAESMTNKRDKVLALGELMFQWRRQKINKHINVHNWCGERERSRRNNHKRTLFFFSPQLLSTLGEIGYYFHLDEMLALL